MRDAELQGPRERSSNVRWDPDESWRAFKAQVARNLALELDAKIMADFSPPADEERRP